MKIGLVGRKYSGKSTVAGYLVGNYEFEEYCISTPLKDVGIAFGFTYEEMYKRKTKINPVLNMCSREFLQVFGTEFGRNFSKYFPNSGIDNIWMHFYKEWLKSHVDYDIVVSDIRFPDEAITFKEHCPDGVLIRVTRDNCFNTDTYSEHVSETLLDSIDCDYTINNSGSFNYLYSQVNDIINLL